MVLKKLHDPVYGKLRVVGLASGSGNTLWKVLEQQREMEQLPDGCPYEIVGLFSDSPGSKAVERAAAEGIPCRSLDIRAFHASQNAPITDMDARKLYDRQVAELIRPFDGDMILLAGYVWATTEPLTAHYLMVNVHPADLSVTGPQGRLFAGADGVGETLRARQTAICSSAHLATDEIDGGPILMQSPACPIDYEALPDFTGLRKTVLKAVNDESRRLGARTVLEIASGHFARAVDGMLHYKGVPVPRGHKVDSWENRLPLHQKPIRTMLDPDSVVVVGASPKGGLGNAVLNNIVNGGYRGRAYAVNRSGESVAGVPGFSDIARLPECPELAVITTPSQAVLDAVEDCGRMGVRNIVCISAGFREIGAVGAAREEQLAEIADQWNMRVLGPNCMGLLNAGAGSTLNATMLQHQPKPGNVAFITQSGAMGAVLLDYADQLGIGFSKVVSLGNQMDVSANDILAELIGDDQTEVAMLYLESIADPPRFLRLTAALTAVKPVIVLKSGRTSEGAVAASSHTGSLAGSDQAVELLLQKAGAIRAETLEEAFNLAAVLSKVKPAAGNRIGVVTNAGGPGILVTDRLSGHGFVLPQLPAERQRSLAEVLFPEASTGNPVDVVAAAPPEHYALALESFAASGGYDALAVICIPPATVDTGRVAEAIIPVAKQSGLPVITCFMGPTLGDPARQVLREHAVPWVDYPEKAADLLRRLAPSTGRAAACKSPRDTQRVHQARKLLADRHPSGYLRVSSAMNLLSLYGIPVSPWAWHSPEAVQPTPPLPFPLVAKIEHPDLTHKSDNGGVILNIQDEMQLQETLADLLQRFPGADGVLIQQQARISQELILGAKLEEGIGHLCMIGAGGTLVELLEDVSLGLSPIGPGEAHDMIRRLRIFPALNGYRGREPWSLERLAEMVAGLSTLLSELPDISEADLNPITWDPVQGSLLALDCRIRVRDDWR